MNLTGQLCSPLKVQNRTAHNYKTGAPGSIVLAHDRYITHVYRLRLRNEGRSQTRPFLSEWGEAFPGTTTRDLGGASNEETQRRVSNFPWHLLMAFSLAHVLAAAGGGCLRARLLRSLRSRPHAQPGRRESWTFSRCRSPSESRTGV